MFEDLSLKNHRLVPVIASALDGRGLYLATNEKGNSYSWGFEFQTYIGVWIMGGAYLLRENGNILFNIEINIAFVESDDDRILKYIEYRNKQVQGTSKVALNIMNEIVVQYEAPVDNLAPELVTHSINDAFSLADLVLAELEALSRLKRIGPIRFWPQEWLRRVS